MNTDELRAYADTVFDAIADALRMLVRSGESSFKEIVRLHDEVEELKKQQQDILEWIKSQGRGDA